MTNKKEKTPLKRQKIELDKPVPSLPLYELKYVNNKWIYVYAIMTPAILKEKPRETPLYFNGGLVTMTLSSECPKNTTNLEVFSLTDIKKLLKAQRESDLLFRKRFKEAHKDKMDSYQERTFIVENKNQKAIGKHIVRIHSKTKEKTSFVGRN